MVFLWDKKVVLVFYREGLELAGIRETFSNEERGRHDGCALQYERPVLAHIISGHVQRHTDEKVQARSLT